MILRGERICRPLNLQDRLMLLWATCAVGSSFFHNDISAALVSRLGLTFDCLGAYWLMRTFIQNLDDFLLVAKTLLLLLIPLAVAMVVEKATDAIFLCCWAASTSQRFVADGFEPRVRSLIRFSLARRVQLVCRLRFCIGSAIASLRFMA